jgi:hypothetical protein
VAQFFQVGGTTLVLPNDARPDLAISSTVYDPNPRAGFDFLYPTDDGFYEIPMQLFCNFSASSTVATRQVYVSIITNGNTTVIQAPAPTTQAADSGSVYTFTTGSSMAYAATVANDFSQAIGMSPYLMLAGYILELSAVNFQATDSFSDVVLTLIKIPSGPQLPFTSAAAPTASPVIV